jgi:hypothetical protein
MRVRIWNAYASNNSGSYTIVGSLPSAEVARAVADELSAMIEAHTAWHDKAGYTDDTDSPLAAFCRLHGLTWQAGRGAEHEWPDYSDDNRPRVVAVGTQVVLHHGYTVTLPPTFGEFIYKRGGRVEHEEDHAHYPIVAVATFWWGWTKEQQSRMEVERPRLIAALTAADGVLGNTSPGAWPAAWRSGDGGFGDAPLTVGAIFADIIDGVTALHDLASRHGAEMRVRLHEAPDDIHDPLAHLRPSRPAPAEPRFDLVVTDAGEHRRAVTTALFDAMGLFEGDADRRLAVLPSAVVRGLSAARADAVAAALRQAGATVDLVRNDG